MTEDVKYDRGYLLYQSISSTCRDSIQYTGGTYIGEMASVHQWIFSKEGYDVVALIDGTSTLFVRQYTEGSTWEACRRLLIQKNFR